MEWLNYHHLLYFWTVAREGSVTRAAERLRLAQPTLSSQIRALEGQLGHKLFAKHGRGLVLTDVGRMVQQYADDIFSIGRELQEAVKGQVGGRGQRLHVGIADVVPKLIAYELLAPAMREVEDLVVVCREDAPERLLGALAIHELDLVITDAPIGPGARVRAFNHLLGQCGVTFFSSSARAAALRRGFPRTLDGEPFLLPLEGTVLRRALEHWFEVTQVRPRVVAELEDSALAKVFGQAGAGAFVAPSAIEEQVRSMYGVQVIGRTDAITERFYAISVERKIRHPAVAAISAAARSTLFAAANA